MLKPTFRAETFGFADYIARSSTRQAERLLTEVQRTLESLTRWRGELQRRVIYTCPDTGRRLRVTYPKGFPNHSMVFEVLDEVVLVHGRVRAERITDAFLAELLRQT